MRLRHKPWAKDFIQKHSEYVLTSVPNDTTWQDIFQNDQPLYVEVGTGKGKFLDNMSVKYPHINFVGIEKFESVLVTGVQRALDTQPDNLKFIHSDVNHLLDFFQEGEVDRLFINFTDPWPKKRHEKRRLTYKTFLELYQQVLRPDGEIHMKTDNQGLFEYSIESMSQFGMKLKNISLDLHRSNIEENVMTEYEEKFSEKGERIYRLEATFPRK
ncbi:tRNA (guanine-N(7)-)-methyltransferase [Alteribacillus persepolensis]|uniref:tRNA (guanine-N(7)-)-methyltransferase n=1 Tax=Alteribacillus persepolensis TaxID=568899 RepID=A0A1G8E4P2_9BACI|nr:tRNA (guanosine(46)-N7)-methyltransferase TrmB [Alteribacillus persepolensis]SDH64834.1 tRNA (guanine-N(7)-)-methyltransferase [Alteribacillus persepolensis]